MDVAKPKGMYQRGAVWWARKDVPKELREINGQTSLKRTLGTSDIEIAKITFHGVMQGFEATIAKARKQLAGQAPSDLMISIPMAPDMIDSVVRWEASKPENQIRNMLEMSKLVPEQREARSLDQVFKQWVKERQPTKNTQEECERAKGPFIALNGDLPIGEFTTEHARKWKEYVVDLTYNGRPLAHATREKTYGSVATLFRFADRNDDITMNPLRKSSWRSRSGPSRTNATNGTAMSFGSCSGPRSSQ